MNGWPRPRAGTRATESCSRTRKGTSKPRGQARDGQLIVSGSNGSPPITTRLCRLPGRPTARSANRPAKPPGLNVEQSDMNTNMNERDKGTPDPDTRAREYPVTYDDASRYYGPGTHTARERHDELSMREHLARAYAKLTAAGTYDPARHGTGDTEPL